MTEIAVVPNGGTDEIHKIGCKDIGKRVWFELPADEVRELTEPKILPCARNLITT